MDLKYSNKLFHFALTFVILFLLYKIILEVYTYIIAIFVLVILIKVCEKRYINRIEVSGQGVLITGCDTGKGGFLYL